MANLKNNRSDLVSRLPALQADRRQLKLGANHCCPLHQDDFCSQWPNIYSKGFHARKALTNSEVMFKKS
jgi:hypothetical protein